MRKKFTHLIMKFKINDAVSFVHAHLSQISFSNFLNRRLVQFELYPLRVKFADFYQRERSFKRIQRVLFWDIDQDRHFIWRSFMKPWDWKLAWQDGNVPSNDLIQALLGCGTHHLGHFKIVLC